MERNYRLKQVTRKWPTVIEDAIKLADNGYSFAAISREIYARTGIAVDATTVRGWLLKQDEQTDKCARAVNWRA